jgi:hypothetical protein
LFGVGRTETVLGDYLDITVIVGKCLSDLPQALFDTAISLGTIA